MRDPSTLTLGKGVVHPMQREIVLVCVVSLAACGCSADSDRLADELEEVRAHVSMLKSEVEDHFAESQNAAALSDLWALEGPHERATGSHTDMLGDAMRGMQTCAGGRMAGVEAMMAMHEECVTEMHRHGAAISEAEGLDEAWAEEQRHHEAMTGCLAEMESMADEVMDRHGMMSCRHR
jgi:hypothetical protein